MHLCALVAEAPQRRRAPPPFQVHTLLSYNADVNYQDADGRSTLYVLALEGRVDMADYVLARGADPEVGDLEGRTPLHVAAWQGHAPLVDLLLSRGALVDAQDADQRTALQSAAWQGQAHVVRLLLERGAQVGPHFKWVRGRRKHPCREDDSKDTYS